MDSRFSGRILWVTGAGGLIGSYVAKELAKRLPDSTVAGPTRAALDLLDFAAVEAAFRKDDPAAIIHCAAMCRIPECETNPSLAHRSNVEATQHLAQLASGRPFVFFSSDQVFDGQNAPYKEDARPNPLSVYARTKAQAEELVVRNSRHLVVRTSLNGGTSPTGDRGFNEMMRVAWQRGEETTLFTDEYRCPLHAAETARAVCALMLGNCEGIYHVAGNERLSRFELGKLLASRWPQLAARIREGSLRDYKGPPRAPDLSFDCTKAEGALKRHIPGIAEWLRNNPTEIF